MTTDPTPEPCPKLGIDEECVDDVDLSPESFAEFTRGQEIPARSFLTQEPAAVEGQGGRHKTWWVVRRVLSMGLSPKRAAELICEHYNPRCQPPWRADEIHDMCRRAATVDAAPDADKKETRAPVEVLDRAYAIMLDGLRLSEEDRLAFVKRGLTSAEIQRLGYRSWSHDLTRWYSIIHRIEQAIGGEDLLRVPGIVRTSIKPEFSIRGSGQLIPVRNLTGAVVAIRIRQVFRALTVAGQAAFDSDGSPAIRKQYVWMSGRREHPEDARVAAVAHVPLHDDTMDTSVIRVTEGEIKADIATLRTGILTVSVPGVSSWRLAVRVAKALGAKCVLVAFDADAETNRDVASAIVQLAERLHGEGVHVAIESWDTELGKGIDDVVSGGHIGRVKVHAADDAGAWLHALADRHGIGDPRPLWDQADVEEEPHPAAGLDNVVKLQVVQGGRGASSSDEDWETRARRRRLTDLGNAERFLDGHGEDVGYCDAWNKWIVWTGKRWEVDTLQRVQLWAEKTVRHIYKEARDEPDSSRRVALAGWAARSEAASRIAAMLKLAEPLAAVSPDQFDRDPWVFNVANGTLDLRTGNLREHRREDRITKLAPVEYEPGADRTLVDTFLERVQPDPEVRSYLWRRWGYGLTGDVGEHVLAIDYGAGRNGKSTAMNAILAVMGDYGVQVPAELLVDRPGGHPTDRTTLHGRRTAVATETDEGAKLNVSLVKLLTGGDPITARRMREDFWTFNPTHKLTLITNHKPQIRETKDAIWKRVHLVPWAVQIPDGEQDKALSHKLRGPGLLRALVEGCLDYQHKCGLLPPGPVVAASRDYRDEQDLLGGFIDECLEEDDASELEGKVLYGLYTEWVEENGHRAMSRKKLTQALDERALGTNAKSTTTGRMVRQGVKARLAASASDEAMTDDEIAALMETNPPSLPAPTIVSGHENSPIGGSGGSGGDPAINSSIAPHEEANPDLPLDPPILPSPRPGIFAGRATRACLGEDGLRIEVELTNGTTVFDLRLREPDMPNKLARIASEYGIPLPGADWQPVVGRPVRVVVGPTLVPGFPGGVRVQTFEPLVA